MMSFSAGVGRTGVVIAIDNIVAEARETGFVDVFNFVALMRQSRPHMVQTSVCVDHEYGKSSYYSTIRRPIYSGRISASL